MPGSSGRPPLQLWLSEGPRKARTRTSWAGPLVALGGMASRYAKRAPGRQLIVALSVPSRDFAAVLVGCGWVLASGIADSGDPLEVLGNCSNGTPVRLVTDHYVLTDRFVHLRDKPEPRVKLQKSQWIPSSIRAASILPGLDRPLRTSRPKLGSLGRWAGHEATWSQRLAAPRANLAIVGTRKWLETDLTVTVGIDLAPGTEHVDAPGKSETIAGVLLAKDDSAPTWFTSVIASSRLDDQLPFAPEINAVVLDGVGAIKYLTEIETAVVICILDRSVADETAGEIVVQLRNTRGEPVSLRDGVGWRPPVGIEAVAYTVAL